MTRALADPTQTWTIRLTTGREFADLAKRLAELGNVEVLRKLGRPGGYNQLQRARVLSVLVPILQKEPDAPAKRLVESLTRAGITTKFGAVFTPTAIAYYSQLVRQKLKERR